MITYKLPSARTGKLLFLLAAIVLHGHTFATKRKVFFIGNSYTYTNSMPDMLSSFATAMGDTLTYAMSAPGGYTFQQHTTLAASLSGISSQPWDIIVLQEQSQMPSFPPAQVATDVYPYARWLDSAINEQDSCIETMFMQTWGRKNGDAMNCPSYPVVCTYIGMQNRLRESYMQMAQDNHASIAPMGAAWKMVIDSFPAIDLYQADESHPSIAGSYLQACVFYTSIFHRSAQGCTYLGGLTAAVAANLQRVADRVVLDSISQWQGTGHYPYAGYAHTWTGSMTFSFTNTSQRADSYSWNFGDGGTSTSPSPSHGYTAAGIYTVSLTVSNECMSATRTDTIHVGPVPTVVGSMGNAAPGISVAASGNGDITFLLPAANTGGTLQVYDMAGRLIKEYAVATARIKDNFPAGVYLYHYIASGSATYTGRFVSY
ncbi:hypothetical protein GCM10023093_08660 [Nemorincola caseinilytica]|uniref:PKD domain-containing protein n=1 Tax=Nemorincola caseinilytica TaxID=2054315 RepID=A0ABP8NAQ1_9BACT